MCLSAAQYPHGPRWLYQTIYAARLEYIRRAGASPPHLRLNCARSCFISGLTLIRQTSEGATLGVDRYRARHCFTGSYSKKKESYSVDLSFQVPHTLRHLPANERSRRQSGCRLAAPHECNRVGLAWTIFNKYDNELLRPTPERSFVDRCMLIRHCRDFKESYVERGNLIVGPWAERRRRH